MKNVVFFFAATSSGHQYEALIDEEQSVVKSTKYTNRAQEKYTYFFW